MISSGILTRLNPINEELKQRMDSLCKEVRKGQNPNQQQMEGLRRHSEAHHRENRERTQVTP